jgi:hypothetical protein
MSKRRKKHKTARSSQSARAPQGKSTIVKPGPSAKALESSPLVRFDRKTRVFLLVLLTAYFAFSLLKIHTSSIANWDVMFGKPASQSVLLGTPKFIRMDEWMVSSPSILSQYALGMPVRNDTLGGVTTPVVWGLPVKDVSTILRPVLWSYFIFDVERAFAFAWNFKIFIFLISTFLTLMLLTRNSFSLSVCGAFFIFFSGAMQWWSYAIADYMLYLNGIFISLIYIMYSKKRWPLILAGITLLLSAYGFIFNLYPPFQVPLAHLYLLIFVGYLLTQKDFLSITQHVLAKTIVVSVVVLIFTVFAYHYYLLVRNTYATMLNTAYPGRRFSTGGDLISGKLFVEFFGVFMSDQHFPPQWGNICETSGFFMFFPIVFYCMVYDYVKNKTIDPLLVALSVYVVAGLTYLLIGFPTLLSKVTLISMSPAKRFLPILGAANCILLVCYLARKRAANRFSWIEFGILAVGVIAFATIAGLHINNATKNFFTWGEITTVTIMVSIVYLLVRYKDYRFATPALCVLLMAIAVSNATVNPVTIGLSSILDNPLLKITRQIHKQDPQARWALFGDTRITNLLKANGISLLNCVKLIPAFDDMRVLDPTGDYYSAYNRYAWIAMYTYIDGKDTVTMGSNSYDTCTISMDPCSPRLKELGVKYLVFTKPPTGTRTATSATFTPKAEEVRCMTKVAEISGIFVYKRNDE